MNVTCADDSRHEELAFNEVSLIRQTHNAAHIRVEVDGKHQVEELVCDGILLATPVGSTATTCRRTGRWCRLARAC